MIEMKYLILSNENNCVYTSSPRKHTALALAEGNTDSYVLGLTYANVGDYADYDKITNRDVFWEKVWHLDVAKSMKFTTLSDDSVSDSWKVTRNELRIRQEAFFLWETLVHNAYAKLSGPIWDQFDIFAEHELAKCEPDDDKYEWTIEEYARIMDQPVKQAYKELKLQIESDKMKRFRIETMAKRWKNEINKIKNRDDLADIRQKMNREFWKDASI
jgi:hypothetical protein